MVDRYPNSHRPPHPRLCIPRLCHTTTLFLATNPEPIMYASMASSWCLSASSSSLVHPWQAATNPSVRGRRSRSILLPPLPLRRKRSGVVCMAPEEEKMTRRSPLDFPIEWERPKPGRRPDIFPRFSPMKTPLPTPLPADPPEEDEEEEEKKEEEEEDPDKEEPEKPEQQSRMRHIAEKWWF